MTAALRCFALPLAALVAAAPALAAGGEGEAPHFRWFSGGKLNASAREDLVEVAEIERCVAAMDRWLQG